MYMHIAKVLDENANQNINSHTTVHLVQAGNKFVYLFL